jgi:membrane protein implicated in regulation of membrane protease activity
VCLGFAVMAAYLVYSVITVRKFYERNSERERLEAEKLKWSRPEIRCKYIDE